MKTNDKKRKNGRKLRRFRGGVKVGGEIEGGEVVASPQPAPAPAQTAPEPPETAEGTELNPTQTHPPETVQLSLVERTTERAILNLFFEKGGVYENILKSLSECIFAMQYQGGREGEWVPDVSARVAVANFFFDRVLGKPVARTQKDVLFSDITEGEKVTPEELLKSPAAILAAERILEKVRTKEKRGEGK
ncbi:MAG: hypothetical protein LBT00_13265 [Spirochaetaceae bacterium]|jgi:hypothetical protein|nr:hypothetical protein [Spirochaetaceae bacterium]